VNSLDIPNASPTQLRALRNSTVAIAFQDPQASLNPLMPIVDQVAEPLTARGVSREAASLRAIAVMSELRIPHLQGSVYPHHLSGGMRQRVLLAMALIREPELLIIDEPTTALDVITQREVLDLIRSLIVRSRVAVLLISHDLSVVAETCDTIGVMYAGKLVELAPTSELLARPKHPYSQGLIRSIPVIRNTAGRLITIPGSIPQPLEYPAGCRFHPRCPAALEVCATDEPMSTSVSSGHLVSCWLTTRPNSANDVWSLKEESEQANESAV
jgi:oligopeptide/dipeptide ABC transporter ATP-binding protein